MMEFTYHTCVAYVNSGVSRAATYHEAGSDAESLTPLYLLHAQVGSLVIVSALVANSPSHVHHLGGGRDIALCGEIVRYGARLCDRGRYYEIESI